MQNFNKSNILIVENAEQIVGYCQYSFESELADLCNADGEIEKLYVEPLATNCGIGTFLFKKIRDIFLSHNKHSFVLWCFNDATHTKKFYQKMGGKILKQEYRTLGNKSYLDLCFIFEF